MKKEFLGYLLGNMSPALFFAALLIAFLGAVIGLWLSTSNRDKDSMRTPTKFSWSFMFCDNVQRLTINVLLIIAAIRFGDAVLGLKVTADNLQAAFFIGLGLDKIPEALRNKGLLDNKK
jgi:hypothetical protein